MVLRAVMIIFCVSNYVFAQERGQRTPPPEANRPPVFFREDWKHQFDTGGSPEGPAGQEHVSNPSLEVKFYGEQPKGDPVPAAGQHTHAGMWMNKRFAADPAHLFTGTCNMPCGLALRHKTQWADLSGFGSKIRWLVKVSGFHQVRPILKLADGTWLVGNHTDEFTEAFDWYVSEFSIADVRWRRLDINKVVTSTISGGSQTGWVTNADLSKVDEIGFVDLMPGSSHGNGGFSDVGWIEVHGRAVPRE